MLHPIMLKIIHLDGATDLYWMAHIDAEQKNYIETKSNKPIF